MILHWTWPRLCPWRTPNHTHTHKLAPWRTHSSRNTHCKYSVSISESGTHWPKAVLIADVRASRSEMLPLLAFPLAWTPISAMNPTPTYQHRRLFQDLLNPVSWTHCKFFPFSFMTHFTWPHLSLFTWSRCWSRCCSPPGPVRCSVFCTWLFTFFVLCNLSLRLHVFSSQTFPKPFPLSWGGK